MAEYLCKFQKLALFIQQMKKKNPQEKPPPTLFKGLKNKIFLFPIHSIGRATPNKGE
jgi:hypothetical protein